MESIGEENQHEESSSEQEKQEKRKSLKESRIAYKRSLTMIHSRRKNIKKLSEYIPKEYRPQNLWNEY